jgi:hypothetical protein
MTTADVRVRGGDGVEAHPTPDRGHGIGDRLDDDDLVINLGQTSGHQLVKVNDRP